MPELAEVELARRIWEPGLGQRVLAVETHPRTRVFRDTPASHLESTLADTILLASRAHGKRLLFSFSSPEHPGPSATGNPRPTRSAPRSRHLELHLGMAGRLFIASPDHPAARHDHFVLRTAGLSLVYSDYRQFGRLFLHEPVDDPWAGFPPQVLATRFTIAHLAKLAARRARTSVKALLLDQSAFPGVGNWMADEICWRLPCHPATPAGALEPALLRRVSRQVCRGAMRHVADRNAPRDGSAGFSPGRYVEHVPPRSWLFQHRWKPGGACPRCHATLARGTVASRSTAWCPICQGTGASET